MFEPGKVNPTSSCDLLICDEVCRLSPFEPPCTCILFPYWIISFLYFPRPASSYILLVPSYSFILSYSYFTLLLPSSSPTSSPPPSLVFFPSSLLQFIHLLLFHCFVTTSFNPFSHLIALFTFSTANPSGPQIEKCRGWSHKSSKCSTGKEKNFALWDSDAKWVEGIF